MEALRKKIRKRINAGNKLKDIAERYDVNVKTVYKVRDMVKAGDTTFKDKKRSGRPRTTWMTSNRHLAAAAAAEGVHSVHMCCLSLLLPNVSRLFVRDHALVHDRGVFGL